MHKLEDLLPDDFKRLSTVTLITTLINPDNHPDNLDNPDNLD